MLAASFFVSVFSSLLWLIFALGYISDNTVGIKLSSLGALDLSIYIMLAVLPVFVLWMIFGYINQYLQLRGLNKNLYTLFKQMKKNQDYTDLIARVLLESEQHVKDGFVLNRLDILISDMNELLASLISRTNVATAEQIENLWNKVRNGSKGAFGKVIIDVSQNQPNFSGRILSKAQSDIVLSGTVLEFCARYQNILTLLEKHDKERIFLNVIETGVLGKVYSVIAPVADDIRHFRETGFPVSRGEEISESTENRISQSLRSAAEETPVQASARFDDRPEISLSEKRETPFYNSVRSLPEIKESIFEKFSFFKKKKSSVADDYTERKDPFSMALERSFAEEENEEENNAPIPGYFEEKDNDEMPVPTIGNPSEEDDASVNDLFVNRELAAPALAIYEEKAQRREETEEKRVEPIPLSHTQRTLDILKKEWEDRKNAETNIRREPVATQSNPVEKASGENDFVYPFGGWTNEDNYNK